MQDCYVNLTELGSQTLTISFEYEDKNGNIFTLEPQTYTIEVNQSNLSSVTIDNNQVSSTTMILIGITAIIVLTLIIAIITSIRGKRKEFSE